MLFVTVSLFCEVVNQNMCALKIIKLKITINIKKAPRRTLTKNLEIKLTALNNCKFIGWINLV
jgi:hypothetical protein